MRKQSCDLFCRFLLVSACVLVMGSASVALAQSRPASFSEFEAAVFVEGSSLTLSDETINKIKGGCPCDVCDGSPPECTPTNTYMYFPTRLNCDGNPKTYFIPVAKQIVIDRTTSLFLAGLDGRHSQLSILPEDMGPTDSEAPALMTVKAAPLINISNLHLWPDVSHTQSNGHPGGPVVVEFANNSTPVQFEIQNSLVEGGKFKISGAGTYRFQAVTAESLGAVDAIIDIDHPGADVTIVGGLYSNSGAYHPGYGAGPLTCPQAPGQGAPSACTCAGEVCTSPEILNIVNSCSDNHLGCPSNPCRCESYFVWQRQGRLRMFSSALIEAKGQSDIRIDKASSAPHFIVNARSEGPKCTTNYPSTMVRVPTTTDAVGLVMLNSDAAWVHGLPGCAGAFPAPVGEKGNGRLIDYNGTGKVWLVGNIGTLGAGRLVTGTAPGATIVASANRFFGNNEHDAQTPLNPRNLLPMNKATCPATGQACYGGDPTSCGGACPAPGLSLVKVGNMWSRGVFCCWCSDQPQAVKTACESYCPLPLACDDVSADVFVDQTESFSSHVDIPDLPETIVPLPIDLPPVDSPRPGMVDAAAECRDNLCFPDSGVSYYPDDCYWCSGGLCVAGSYPTTHPNCWIQAGLNKGLREGKPVYIPQGTYQVNRPQYWAAKDMASQIPANYGGGWIVGQNNNVTIWNTDAEPVWTTDGMTNGVIQGITFQSPDYASLTTATTVDIENDTATGRHTASITFHDCNFKGGHHAFGLCMRSPTQCDTIMTVNGTFSNATIGWAAGGWNAMQNIAYNATFLNNNIAMGHEDGYGPAGWGNWAALHATISSTAPGEKKDINLYGSDHPFYFYGVQSSNKVVLDEADLAQERSWSVMFDHCDLAKNNPYDPPPNGIPVIDFAQAIGPMFLNSELNNGWVNLPDLGTTAHARGAVKLKSRAVRWPNNQLPESSSNQISKLFEFEICRTPASCAPCNLLSQGCVTFDTGDMTCLRPGIGWTTTCAGTLTYQECNCKNKPYCPARGETQLACP